MQRVGTIGHALTLEDNSHVYLDAVEISKSRSSQTPSYVVAVECFSPHDRIVVLVQPAPELRVGETVDVEGDLTTLESGDRAIVNATIWGYTDSSGTLLYHGPLIKGLLGPTPWEWKTNLSAESQSPRTESEPEPPGEVSTDSSVNVVFCSTIADAEAQDVGTVVELRGKPVSSVGSGYLMLGQDGSSDTLKTFFTGSVSSSSRVCVVRGTIDTDGTNPVLDLDSGPNYDEQESFQGGVLTASEGTVAWIKTWADGHTFSSGDITGKIVTRNWTDYLYIEEDDRSSGIRVQKTAHGHAKGERVNVVGTLATNADGERYIAASTITQNGTGTLTPLGMNGKWLGGGDFAYDPGPPISGQRGVTDVPGVPSTPAYGLNNIGLLVRTWGKVTELDTANPPLWFRIDDGSSVQTTVAYPPFSYAVDDYASITGISSCEVDTNSDLQRVLRPQPLTCIINQASGQSDPTNTSPVNFTVVFSDPVSDFTGSDVTLNGVAGATAAVTGSGTAYNVAVSLPTAGTITASISAGVAQNDSGVWNYASTSTDNSVTFDNVPPAAPTNVFLDLLVTATNKLHASWTAPSDPDLAGYDYKITYLDVNDGEHTAVDWTSYSSTEITRTLTLSLLGRYTFHVRAKDTLGNLSSEATNPTPVQSWGGRVGFLYDLCVDTASKNMIDGFLLDEILSFSSDVVYNPSTTGHVTWPSGSDRDTVLAQLTPFNVILLVLPQRALTTAENQAMEEYANGFQKRVVFVGDYSPYYATQVDYLNSAMTAQGMYSQFFHHNYDASQDYSRHCLPQSPGNCLTQGVNYLWDYGCGGMNNPNVMFITPPPPGQPIGDFLAGTDWRAGQADLKRIVISDRDVFRREYGPNTSYNPYHASESISQANAKFLDNLCTKW